MHRMNPLVRNVIFALAWVLFTSCAIFSKPSEPIPPPAPFEEAISSLADSLLDRIKTDQTASAGKDKTYVMLIPFSDADTGEVPQISRKIEAVFSAVASRNYEGFDLARLNSKNIHQADYIINGTIGLDVYPGKGAEAAKTYYRVTGEVTRVKDKIVIGKSNRWISDQDIRFAPTPIYRDSPLYFKGSRLPAADHPSQPPRDEIAVAVSLETTAILVEARMAYENGDYETAEALFKMASKRPDGQDLDTYAGLYLANHKLGRLEEAEKAFARLVAISAEKYRSFTVKYLFGVNSVEFLKDKNLEDRYQTWIRNIGKYFHNNDKCLRIVGHSSQTGTRDYNDKLSLDRAKSIQTLLEKSFPEVYQRSEVVGKGFSENIVGTGTDDDRDALDRRVELFVIDCK